MSVCIHNITCSRYMEQSLALQMQGHAKFTKICEDTPKFNRVQQGERYIDWVGGSEPIVGGEVLRTLNQLW